MQRPESGQGTRKQPVCQMAGKGKRRGKREEEPEKRGDLPKVMPQRVGRESGAWLLSQPGDLSARLCYSK